MNGANAHLLVNHIPLFGVTFGLLALLWATLRKSPEMRSASVGLFLLAGLFSWISMETGESAEELVEHLPGVTEALIHAHEEAAEAANAVTIVLALSGVVMLIVGKTKKELFNWTQWVTVGIAVLAAGLMARAAHFGGQIRHTEIRSENVSQNNHPEKTKTNEAQEQEDD